MDLSQEAIGHKGGSAYHISQKGFNCFSGGVGTLSSQC